MANRKLRFGMIGGGIGSFIGPVHRMAACLDNEAELVSGVFSSDPDKSIKSGKALYLDPKRVYTSYKEMLKKELALPPGDRIDFVSIVTPNSMHFQPARDFMKAGIHVVCDKPMTLTLAEAKTLERVVKETGCVFVLTHAYTGYPMAKQARHMVAKGELGKINKVIVEYPQGWLSGLLRSTTADFGVWRMDPKTSGASCCTGDIGIHAENLARYITGLEIKEVTVDLNSYIKGNKLDDDVNVLMRYKGGAKGILHASQISSGEENGLNIRVYGDKKGLYWAQEDPNYLIIKDPSGFQTRLSKGNDILCKAAREAARLPFGHPDGLIGAFANLYMEAYKDMRAQAGGKKRPPKGDYPTVTDGVIGMAFVQTVLASATSKTKWTAAKV